MTTYSADWVFGDVACRLTYALRETNKYASLLTLVALSVDRCLATYHRLSHLRSIVVGVGVCAAIWLVSLLAVGSPYVVYSRVVDRAGRRSCVVRWPWTGQVGAQRAWIYGHLSIGVVVPLCLIAVANVLLLRRLRLFAFVRAGSHSTGGVASVGRGALSTAAVVNMVARASRRHAHHVDNDDDDDVVQSSVRRQRASQNMARLVLAIVVIFVVCQLPYHIMEVADLLMVPLNAAEILLLLPSLSLLFITILAATHAGNVANTHKTRKNIKHTKHRTTCKNYFQSQRPLRILF